MSDDKKTSVTLVENMNQSLEAPEIDPVYLSVANDYLSGMDAFEIAEEYNIEPDLAIAILEKPEIKAYVENVYLTQGYLHRGKRLALINKVIEKKVEEAMLTDEWSKKDLLDWIKEINNMENSTRPKKGTEGPQVAVQINNYDKVLDHLSDKDEK